MKIGLITFHDTNNFGSYLQTYGLYKTIVDLGFKCDVIDYQCESIIKRELPKPFKFTLNPKKMLIQALLNPKYKLKYKNLLSFLHSNMTLSERVNRANVNTLSDKYDKFIVGSDIVWGLDIVENDTAYFLDFINDSGKKFAFSSSVGTPWNVEQKELVKPHLETFTKIAVRENESADWVEELIGNRPDVVCDPTMLVESSKWREYSSSTYAGKNYVLVYFPTDASLKAAKQYAEAHGIPCYVINNSLPLNGVTNVSPITLDDFLSLFINATFVCTGSYHGMLFSIYFNREFAYFNRAHKSRMNTIAHRLGVLDREGTENNIMTMRPIEYSKVNKAVEEYRIFSTKVLKEMLEK